MADIKYSPKLPINVDSDNNFIHNIDVIDNIKQNIRMIVLTNPGEKIMDPRFGLGIKKYLFEQQRGAIVGNFEEYTQNSSPNLHEQIINNLKKQVSLYLENVNITKVTYNYDDNLLELYIEFIYGEIFTDNLLVTAKL